MIFKIGVLLWLCVLSVYTFMSLAQQVKVQDTQSYLTKMSIYNVEDIEDLDKRLKKIEKEW